tara:strand:+ start:1385 stop:1579 length:195 start_codon:yes stop_codon:yes gene_type:complete
MKKTKIVKIPIFTYTGMFACVPKIEWLIFEVDVADNSLLIKNYSFADKYNSVSKSAKNKKSKLC